MIEGCNEYGILLALFSGKLTCRRANKNVTKRFASFEAKTTRVYREETVEGKPKNKQHSVND